jgi:Lon-like protease
VLDPGDKILRVDGTPVATVDALVAELAGKKPGDTVELEIQRPEAGRQTVDVRLIASPDDPSRTIIGFIPFDTASIQLPFEISIDTGEIGGPSAGLAFTLTLIDELSEGDLTGGSDIAVTGEIGVDGSVGAIGGLAQKVSAVKQVGVHHFLVPESQGEEQLARAREIAGDDLEIIPVATLDEALAALERLGGDPVVPVN